MEWLKDTGTAELIYMMGTKIANGAAVSVSGSELNHT